jgi:preprotein translocase subunit SecE
MARNPARPRNPTRPNIGITPGRRFSVTGFFGEVWAELRRVTWPSRQEATRLTILVLSISIAFGVFLGFADMLFAELLRLMSGT